MYSKYGLMECKIGEDTTTITNLNSLHTSWGIRIPLCSSTIRSDSTSFFFAMGSIPLQIISWMQSHELSRRTSTDIYRSNRLSKCKNKTSLNNSFYWHMRIKLYILIFPAHQKISMMYKFYFSNSRIPTYP